MPLNQYGQTPIDPRAALLLGRAQRPEPIDTSMSLIGRLAALGVGQSQQRGFEQQIAESRLGYSQALQQAGNDPTARLSVLSQAAASPDPSMRADALQQIAAMTQPQEQPETFRPLTAEEAQAVGLPAGASAQISSRGKISTLFTPSEPAGPTTSVREFTDVFGRPPESPEEFARFQAMKRPPGATVNVVNGDARVAQIGAETTARVQATADVKQAEQQAAKARYQEQARTTLAQIEAEIAAAGMGGALSPSQSDKIEGLRTAAAIAMARAQSENPEQEPNSDIVQGLKASIPTAMKGAAGITGGLDAAYSLVGGRPQTTTAPAAGGQPNLSPAELRRMADLLEKARAAQ